MYESYYGLSEKPFSLTPDPKYLFRSPSHGSAFDLLRYAIGRREGFVVVTGDIGTGKTTLCRALLDQIDRTTHTALVLNPFLSEEDLLKRTLQDFGVVTRAQIRDGQLSAASKQELVDTLHDFLLGLVPQGASAVLVIDEAQNLPLPVLEQVRILSNLETDKEKLLQIVLVGQLNLGPLLRSPGLRQLDQRVSIRYQLEPLDRDAVAAYVSHRLTIAGSAGALTFAPDALELVHRLSGGIPRLINLICDRALLGAYSVRESRVTRDMVAQAAASLDFQPGAVPAGRYRASIGSAAAVALTASVFAVGSTAYLYTRLVDPAVEAAALPSGPVATGVASAPGALPAEAQLTILVGAYPAGGQISTQMAALAARLEAAGYPVYFSEVDRGSEGRWRRLLAGAYTDLHDARRGADRLAALLPGRPLLVIDAALAGQPVHQP